MTTFIKEDVVWFDVTVNDAYFMETLNGKNLQMNRFMKDKRIRSWTNVPTGHSRTEQFHVLETPCAQ